MISQSDVGRGADVRAQASTSTAPAPVKEEDEEEPVDEREAQLAAGEWALERECELARLELENGMLTQLVAEHEGVVSATSGAEVRELPRLSTLPKLPARLKKRQLGGKDIGPFGMYKKYEEQP